MDVRGDKLLQLVRKIPSHGINKYHFNDMSDFDINVFPLVVWNELNNFNADMYEGQLAIEQDVDKQCIVISQGDQEDASKNLQVKVKFYNTSGEEIDEEDESAKPRIRIQFKKKRGDLASWYEIFKQIRETTLKDVLMSPFSGEYQQAQPVEETREAGQEESKEQVEQIPAQ